MVALGATPREAAFPSIKAAVGAGMTPLLAQLSAAGIVQIPGMMSGQILAGADPYYRGEVPDRRAAHDFCGHDALRCDHLLSRLQERFSVEGYYLSPALRDDAGEAA